METLAPIGPEQKLEFNEQLRLRNNTETWLAEALDGSMVTSFEYSYYGSDFITEDGQSVTEMFDDSVEDAKKLPVNLAFECRRRPIEREELDDMKLMMESDEFNTLVVESDFPPELMHEVEDVGGYNVNRKPTMLRVISKIGTNRIRIVSKTLDRSDRMALEAIQTHLGYIPMPGELLGQRMKLNLDETEQEFLPYELEGVYDRSLAEQHGGEWKAGRHKSLVENTYSFIRSNADLISAYTLRVREFGENPEMLIGIKELLEERMRHPKSQDAITVTTKEDEFAYLSISQQVNLLNEIGNAGRDAIAQGKVVSGCGLTIGGDKEHDLSNQLSDLGYGNKTEAQSNKKEDWKWKTGVCIVPKCPTRPGKTKVGPCSICKHCQLQYDMGKDPEKTYKNMQN